MRTTKEVKEEIKLCFERISELSNELYKIDNEEKPKTAK